MTTAIAPKLSLFDIEIGWLPLLEARADAEEIADPAERARAIEDADVAIAAHAEKEVAKADSYIGICRFLESVASAAKAEEQRQARRRQVADNILKQIKATGLCALQANPRKRIDGTRGSLSIRGNGGVQPLIITDEAIVPLDCKRATVVFRADQFAGWREHLMDIELDILEEKITPDNAAIRAKIAEDGGVPGAYLGERGQRLQIT